MQSARTERNGAYLERRAPALVHGEDRLRAHLFVGRPRFCHFLIDWRVDIFFLLSLDNIMKYINRKEKIQVVSLNIPGEHANTIRSAASIFDEVNFINQNINSKIHRHL